MDDERLDTRLAELFAPRQRLTDAAFVTRVERAVAADRHLAAARKSAWRRFSYEAAASGAVAAAFVLLGRLAPFSFELGAGAMSPAVVAALVLGLWYVVELRPGAAPPAVAAP